MKEIINRTNLALFWSTGKDSAMALHVLQQDTCYNIQKLIITVQHPSRRVSMHGVPEDLAIRQAQQTGIPVHIMYVKDAPDNKEYEKSIEELQNILHKENISHVAFGDIFLEDLKTYRQRLFEPKGFKTVFPLWKKNTRELTDYFFKENFKAIIICTDGEKTGKEFCGKDFTPEVISSFPKGIDPCGENGEFHTFCYDGPVFKSNVSFKKGDIIKKEYEISPDNKIPYYFLDIS